MFEDQTESRQIEFTTNGVRDESIGEDLLLETRNPEMAAMLETARTSRGWRLDHSPHW